MNYYPSFPHFMPRNRVGDMRTRPKLHWYWHCWTTLVPGN